MKKEKKWEYAKIIVDNFLQFGTPIILIVLWEVLGRKGIIPASSMPAPSRIITKLSEKTADKSLIVDLLMSIQRIAKGFFTGAIVAVILGIIISLIKPIEKATSVLIALLRPIPIIALLPLFILWFGIDEKSKTAVIALGTFWPVLINTIQGIKQVDKKLQEVAEILGYSKIQIIFLILIPYAFPYIFTGIRLGIGTALACVVTAEMVAASEGIGYMIMYARMMSQPDVVLLGVFVLGILGLIIEFGMLRIQKSLFRY